MPASTRPHPQPSQACVFELCWFSCYGIFVASVSIGSQDLVCSSRGCALVDGSPGLFTSLSSFLQDLLFTPHAPQASSPSWPAHMIIFPLKIGFYCLYVHAFEFVCVSLSHICRCPQRSEKGRHQIPRGGILCGLCHPL